MKYVVKIIVIIFLVFILFNMGLVYINNRSYATGMGDVASNPEEWTPWKGEDSSELNKKAGVITGAIRTIGIIISIVSLSVIGIRYMVGSVEEKAQYKQTMAPWILGACMVFAITMIPDMIYNLVQEPVYETSEDVGDQHDSGEKAGFKIGMDFMKNWHSIQATDPDPEKAKEKREEKEKKYQDEYSRWGSLKSNATNAEDYGRAEGALNALTSGKNENYCSGYFSADSWIQGKTIEEIKERLNVVSSGTGGIPTSQIAGYCQRLSLELDY